MFRTACSFPGFLDLCFEPGLHGRSLMPQGPHCAINSMARNACNTIEQDGQKKSRLRGSFADCWTNRSRCSFRCRLSRPRQP